MKFNTPEELLVNMSDIDYGFYDLASEKWVSSTKNAKQFLWAEQHNTDVVSMPKEVAKSRMGTCWDCTLLAYEELCKIPRVSDIQAIYCEHEEANDDTCNKETHTAVIFQYSSGSIPVWRWFEHAWLDYRGVNGPYLNKDVCMERLQELFNERHSINKLPNSETTDIFKTWDIKSFLKDNRNKKYVMPAEFMNYCKYGSY